MTDTVTVEASAPSASSLPTPLPPTRSTSMQVRELSLGTPHYQQLVALMPGVASGLTDELYGIGDSSPSGLAATLPYSINGNRTSGNNWSVDGADNVDRGSETPP